MVNKKYIQSSKKHLDDKIDHYFEKMTHLLIEDINGVQKPKTIIDSVNKYLKWVCKSVDLENQENEIEERKKQKHMKKLEEEEKKKKLQERKKEIEKQKTLKEQRRVEREEINRINKIHSIFKQKWVNIKDKIELVKPLLNSEELQRLDKIDFTLKTDYQNLPDFEDKIVSDQDVKNIKDFIKDFCSWILYFYVSNNIVPDTYIRNLQYDLFDVYSNYIITSTGEYVYVSDKKSKIKIPVKYLRNFDIAKRFSETTYVYYKKNHKTFLKSLYENLSIDKDLYLYPGIVNVLLK